MLKPRGSKTWKHKINILRGFLLRLSIVFWKIEERDSPIRGKSRAKSLNNWRKMLMGQLFKLKAKFLMKMEENLIK